MTSNLQFGGLVEIFGMFIALKPNGPAIKGVCGAESNGGEE
jgi:hypothetical protein